MMKIILRNMAFGAFIGLALVGLVDVMNQSAYATPPYHQWQAPACWYNAGVSVGCVQEDGGTTWTNGSQTGVFDPLTGGVSKVTRGLSVDGGLAADTSTVAGSSVIVATGKSPTYSVQLGANSLTAGSATVTFPSAFSSGTTFCTCTDNTAVAATKCSSNGTTLVITGTGTDSINWVCFGPK